MTVDELTKEHLINMFYAKDGVTVFSRPIAKRLRDIQKLDKDLIDIIDNIEKLEYITGEKYDGASEMPFFGAILTDKGKMFSEKLWYERGYTLEWGVDLDIEKVTK